MAFNRYLVDFGAVTAEELPDDAVERLGRALTTMPGVGPFDGARDDGDPRGIRAAFRIDVRLGMADAARDGSRLAKEALKEAGLGAARLVELTVRLEGEPYPTDRPASLRGGAGRSSRGGDAGGAS